LHIWRGKLELLGCTQAICPQLSLSGVLPNMYIWKSLLLYQKGCGNGGGELKIACWCPCVFFLSIFRKQFLDKISENEMNFGQFAQDLHECVMKTLLNFGGISTADLFDC
ncbi:uncharacterized protein A4U43_C03F30750, partial [Asparagus officinalis]